jgi:hypothetical protein
MQVLEQQRYRITNQNIFGPSLSDGLCKRQQVLIEPRTKALLLPLLPLLTAGDADQAALVLVHSSQFHCALLKLFHILKLHFSWR